MKKKRFSKNNLAFNIISAVLVLILIFSVAVGLIGYNTFTDNANYIYGDKANEVASEAMTKIHVNHIERYLKNGKSDKEWLECNRQLQVLCDNMADMIYVICVDGSDYSSYTTVFYAVNKDNATQVPLTLGQKSTIMVLIEAAAQRSGLPRAVDRPGASGRRAGRTCAAADQENRAAVRKGTRRGTEEHHGGQDPLSGDGVHQSLLQPGL